MRWQRRGAGPPSSARSHTGAVTVDVSRAALSGGAMAPTGNASYRRIGYVRIANFAGWKFQ